MLAFIRPDLLIGLYSMYVRF